MLLEELGFSTSWKPSMHANTITPVPTTTCWTSFLTYAHCKLKMHSKFYQENLFFVGLVSKFCNISNSMECFIKYKTSFPNINLSHIERAFLHTFKKWQYIVKHFPCEVHFLRVQTFSLQFSVCAYSLSACASPKSWIVSANDRNKNNTTHFPNENENINAKFSTLFWVQIGAASF